MRHGFLFEDLTFTLPKISFVGLVKQRLDQLRKKQDQPPPSEIELKRMMKDLGMDELGDPVAMHRQYQSDISRGLSREIKRLSILVDFEDKLPDVVAVSLQDLEFLHGDDDEVQPLGFIPRKVRVR